MTSTLMVIQVILAVIIAIAVLLQKSSSIGLGAYTSSNESMFGAKGPAGFLAKFTSIMALLFVINTLALGYFYSKQESTSIMSSKKGVAASKASILDANATASSTTTSSSTEANGTTAGSIETKKTEANETTTGNAETNLTAASSTETKRTETGSTTASTVETNNTDTNNADTNDTEATVKLNSENNASNLSVDTKTNEMNTSATNSADQASSTIGNNEPQETNSTEATGVTSTDNATESITSKITTPDISTMSRENEEKAILSDIEAQKVSSRSYILKGVSFRSGSSILKKTSSSQIDAIASALNKNSNVKILLRGHTDNTGQGEVNQKLSKKRADALKAALVAKGVSETRIETQGLGDASPITSNATKEGKSLNRRVDISVVN